MGSLLPRRGCQKPDVDSQDAGVHGCTLKRDYLHWPESPRQER